MEERLGLNGDEDGDMGDEKDGANIIASVKRELMTGAT